MLKYQINVALLTILLQLRKCKLICFCQLNDNNKHYFIRFQSENYEL